MEKDIKPETKQELKTQQIKPDPDPQSSLVQVTKQDSSLAQVELASVHARRDPDAVELVPSSGELAVPGKTLKQEIKTEAEEPGAGDHDNETKKAVSPKQAPRKQATESTCFEDASDCAPTEDDGKNNNC